MLDAKEKFQDVVWSDKCTVQLDNHSRVCFHQKKEPRKLKPRLKHPVKIHIWGNQFSTWSFSARDLLRNYDSYTLLFNLLVPN